MPSPDGLILTSMFTPAVQLHQLGLCGFLSFQDSLPRH